ncbi:FAD-dependent 5-carboxymethylaminomethyl-2-thiouridine(34) oxidoreductase MnmC [Pseudoduganella aquatica]|uniref:FAD-dependent 5-carboxymethylaminomethyl-2-thiouridine(34) oxidoreductase MnmC n=1 Tax=Pseudoduganella aquatica TaxID=2660641 RepID=UPI001E47C552|nr:FAD-dependent 5-carboxymethylaminomethyl-2-thiouridine(34) oxidoreductase MnmC [Pseudoduganella aquatica]
MLPAVTTPQGWRHVLLATGFGAGEHFLATLAAWRSSGAASVLHYIALLPALPAAQDIAAELRGGWPVNVPGFHRLEFDHGRVVLDLAVGDLEATLPQIEARVDAFHLPAPIAPMRTLAKLALPGATLTLLGADDEALKALRSSGFEWQPAPSGVQAVFTSRKPQPPRAPEPVRQAVVIGAGVAGAAACERLAARGWQVTLVERHQEAAQEASGNRAGIFMPLLSKDDNIPTRLSRAAYLYAMRHWQRLGGVDPEARLPAAAANPSARITGAQCGVLQLARDAEHALLQKEVAAAWNYPREYVRWVDAQEASALLGAPTPDGGWLFSQGGWANPASICRAMLAACGARLTRIFNAGALKLERADDQWQVRAAGGELLAEAPHVILANGAGALAIAQTAELPLYTMRGQVTHLQEQDFPHLPLVVCREAYMTPPVQGIVSVGATYDSDTDSALRHASQQENLSRARDILPGVLPQDPPLAGRVGFRCMAPDRLPLAGPLPDYAAPARPERLRDVPRHAGLYGLLGYASRGLIWAPLAAELLAAQLEHEPLPLEAALAAALDPARFMLKARRGGRV